MRQLVTLRTVSNLFPIEGADFIEIAQVDGWQCIVKKGEFKVGGTGLYFEIDSFLPNEPKYEFLKELKTYKGKQGYRIRTMKMRKVISQGLLLPISFYGIPLDATKDLAEQLGVVKYDVQDVQDLERPSKPGQARGVFPNFIPKTDQERIENLPMYFEIHKEMEFEETLKLDGSSLTAYKVLRKFTIWERIKKFLGFEIIPIHFGVCSRNLELSMDANKTYNFDNGDKKTEYSQSAFWKVAKKYELEERLPVGYTVQGEFIAPNIQSNHEKVNDIEFYCFNVFDINKGSYLLPDDACRFCIHNLIPYVPLINEGVKIFSEVSNIEQLRVRVTGRSMNEGTISEGRVYKSRKNPNISFKCISPEYLLKCEK